MTYIEQFGAPNYGRLKGIEGIVFHTPENNDPSVEAAVATAKWQAGTGNTSGGSYHGILGWDDELGPMSDPDAWVLVKTVPFTDIAGSISTRRDAVWRPGRYPWIEQLLSDAAYADPNAYLHALCLGGRAAWWTDKLSTPEGAASVRGAIIEMARWVRRLEKAFDYDAVLTLHRMWQTNRTDPDGIDFADRVLAEYERLYAAQPAEAPAPDEPSWTERIKARVAQLEADLAEAVALADGRRKTIKRLRGRLTKVDTLADAGIANLNEIKEA